MLAGVLTAVYTAFLFAQCEGRDLWQSRLTLLHLLLHATVAGAAVTTLLAPAWQASHGVRWLAPWCAAASALVILLALIDGFGPHPTPNATAAARALSRGRQASMYWISVIGLALGAALIGTGLAPAAGGAAMLLALWIYGHALVLAGQGPPIS
jgi:formate-dependent nitrite reductase membrane component NrfD